MLFGNTKVPGTTALGTFDQTVTQTAHQVQFVRGKIRLKWLCLDWLDSYPSSLSFALIWIAIQLFPHLAKLVYRTFYHLSCAGRVFANILTIYSFSLLSCFSSLCLPCSSWVRSISNGSYTTVACSPCWGFLIPSLADRWPYSTSFIRSRLSVFFILLSISTLPYVSRIWYAPYSTGVWKPPSSSWVNKSNKESLLWVIRYNSRDQQLITVSLEEPLRQPLNSFTFSDGVPVFWEQFDAMPFCLGLRLKVTNDYLKNQDIYKTGVHFYNSPNKSHARTGTRALPTTEETMSTRV